MAGETVRLSDREGRENDAKVWGWLPTLYLAEALPYVAINTLSVILYTRMGVGMADMAFYTGLLYLPWVIKPLWSSFVDIFFTKRLWVIAMQLIMGLCFLGVAFVLSNSLFFALTLTFFWIAAFSSATHDIAADGYYMLRLNPHQQAAFVGVRSTFYRFGLLFGSGVLVWLAGWIEEKGVLGITDSHLRIVAAWKTVYIIIGVFLLLACVYHFFFMPVVSEKKSTAKGIREVLGELGDTLVTFFRKPNIGGAILFMLFYRLPEAICIKLVAPFLLADRAVGGLGLTTEQLGTANGITGVVAILAGGIIGGIAISRQGLKYWLWPMALSLALPCALYLLLALLPPAPTMTGFIWVNIAIFVEQFGYGFGFTAFMLYLIYFSEGPWKTSHYAFCTAFMALGMMLPGMVAGYIYDFFESLGSLVHIAHPGFILFFAFVLLCSVFTCIACTLVKIDPAFGKK